MDKTTVEVDRSPSGQLQVSIARTDEHGSGHGYRLAGPKYLGNSRQVLTAELSARDAREVIAYLLPLLDEAGRDWLHEKIVHED